MKAGAPEASAPGALSRARAARVVQRVAGRGETLEHALAAELSADLPAADQARVRALAFGSVRWHHRHQAIIRQLLQRPPRRREQALCALLSVGLYQLIEPRQPDYAVVSATVGAARLLGLPRATGLVNAVLRRFQREAPALLAAVDATEAGRYSHPQWLIDRLRDDWPEACATVLAAAQRHPPLWLRVNRCRTTPEDWLALARMPGARSGGAFADAVCLLEPVPVEGLPGFADGLVSVQDAAAQVAAPLLGAEPGMRVLDACAAPGGKSCHLLERAGGRLDLVALDSAPDRLLRLSQNLQRLGLRALVQAGDALDPTSWWDGRPFDRILLDVPCSGTGVIRRHPDIKLLRRPADIPALAQRQRGLLEALWPLLRPGGRLLYASCSLLRAENDQVVSAFLAARPAAALLDSPAVAGLPVERRPGAPGWYLLPGAPDTDGFYYALIGRRDGPAA